MESEADKARSEEHEKWRSAVAEYFKAEARCKLVFGLGTSQETDGKIRAEAEERLESARNALRNLMGGTLA
jgi:hypothetical protein